MASSVATDEEINVLRQHQQIDTNHTTGRQDIERNYTYEPLPSEPTIRLLRVLDLSPGGNVRSVLTTHNLNSLPQYRALSYTWGAPSELLNERGVTADPSYPILCNECILKVTKNLLDALLCLWRTGRTTSADYLWIDAICINQEDDDEKGSQVYLMTDIYRAAQSVIVWLGGSDEDTSLALEVLPTIATIPDEFLTRIDNSDIDLMDSTMNRYVYRHSPEHWRALATLLRRHWFNRVWIIQEFIVAQEVLILCGDSTISIEHLVKASCFLALSTIGGIVLMNLMVDYPGFEGSQSGTISHVYALSALKRQLNGGTPPLHLVEFLAFGSRFEATNPRDKVYALLGLAAKGSRLHPSYNLPKETVYVDATRYVINESHDLAILSMAEDTQDGVNSANNHSVASWVPNFSIPIYIRFKPPMISPNLPLTQIVWQPNPRMLGISGARLETIDYIEDRWNPSTGPRIEGISQWLRILFFSGPTYLNGQSRLEALARTLIENRMDTMNSVGVVFPFQFWLVLEVARLLVEDRARGYETDNTRLICGSLNAIGMFEPPQGGYTILASGNVELFVASLMNGEAIDEHVRDATRLAYWYGELIESTRRHKAFLTYGGRFGTAPTGSKERDTIWIVPGASDPLILRPTGDSDHFRLIGRAYLHGFDLDDVLRNEMLDWQDIILE